MQDEKLGNFGIGFYLYFDIIKKLGILLIVMFVVSIPIVVLNALGNGLIYFQDATPLLNLSMANQNQLKIAYNIDGDKHSDTFSEAVADSVNAENEKYE